MNIGCGTWNIFFLLFLSFAYSFSPFSRFSLYFCSSDFWHLEIRGTQVKNGTHIDSSRVFVWINWWMKKKKFLRVVMDFAIFHAFHVYECQIKSENPRLCQRHYHRHHRSSHTCCVFYSLFAYLISRDLYFSRIHKNKNTNFNQPLFSFSFSSSGYAEWKWKRLLCRNVWQFPCITTLQIHCGMKMKNKNCRILFHNFFFLLAPVFAHLVDELLFFT